MPMPAKPTTKESIVIEKAMRAKRIDNATLAAAVDVHPSFVSQWKNGRRPVPWDMAQAVADELEVEPGSISADYREISASQPARLDQESFDAAFAEAEKTAGGATAEKVRHAYERLLTLKASAASVKRIPPPPIGKTTHGTNAGRTERTKSTDRRQSRTGKG